MKTRLFFKSSILKVPILLYRVIVVFLVYTWNCSSFFYKGWSLYFNLGSPNYIQHWWDLNISKLKYGFSVVLEWPIGWWREILQLILFSFTHLLIHIVSTESLGLVFLLNSCHESFLNVLMDIFLHFFMLPFWSFLLELSHGNLHQITTVPLLILRLYSVPFML